MDEVDIRDVWRALQRRWGTIAFTALLVTLLVAAYLLLATPTWNARTLILVEEDDQGVLINPAVSALTGISGGGSQIETEMRLVQTRPVLEDVVDVLDLNFVVTRPRDVPVRRLFDARQFGRETPYGRYEIRREGSGRYRIRSTDEDTPSLDVGFSPGDRVEIPGGWFVVGDMATGPGPGGDPIPMSIELETLPFQEAVAKLSETISVDRPDPEAAVLRIGYRTTDRSLAYEVPNAVAERFIARRVEHQKIEAMSAVTFLENEAEDTRQQLERVEAELQSYREGQQIVAIGAEAEAQVSRLAALEGQRTQLEAERSALASLVDEIENAEGSADYRRLASFPTFFSNAAIAQLLVKLVEAEQDRTDRLSRLTPSHPDIVALDARIAQLEAQLGSMGRNYLRSLSDQVAALDAALAGFGAQLERIPEREIVAARISRQVDMLAELYTVLQTRLKE
ncbi:MAG TPA: Wzz/FepE/Etk N-terminal domain-containing protein, partial [Longimicrobiaceae bacterium]|nr:Wzz/FepE/Etk N-terminal domain-containing protein [Longimicrobiaceae bacterium]